ncbi:TraM recognition domain-containing protein [Paenarthrobacter aurescens]
MTDNTRKSLLAVLSGQVLGGFDYQDVSRLHSVDIQEFVKGWGTLYVTVPYERKDVLSPLVTAFIEAIIGAWRHQNRPGVIARGTLLLALDEVANIAPLPSLPGIVTTGAGDAIQTILGLQGPSQAKTWGDQADTIMGGTSHVALFPGLRAHEYIRSLADASEQVIAYSPTISVSGSLPAGERFATAERLTDERRYIEQQLAQNRNRSAQLARLQAAVHLAAQRRRDGLWTREDDVTTPHGVLNEVMGYTDVSLDIDRRASIEPSDITHRPKGELSLVTGAKVFFLRVQHWSLDPFWTPVLNGTIDRGHS